MWVCCKCDGNVLGDGGHPPARNIPTSCRLVPPTGSRLHGTSLHRLLQRTKHDVHW